MPPLRTGPRGKGRPGSSPAKRGVRGYSDGRPPRFPVESRVLVPPPQSKPNYGSMPPQGTGQAVLDSISQALVSPPRDPLAPAPQSGPYQGAAGSEAQHPGQQRTPNAGWADPSSPDYERRNYYVGPDGVTVAREPGYYNPDNPFDTGRPGEKQGEFRGMWDPSMERRMDEPGVTPWGPGGKASAPGAFSAPGGSSRGPQPQQKGFLDALLADPKREPNQELYPGLGAGQNEQIPQEFLAFLKALLQKGPAGAQAPRVPFE